jgi:hypothetical protein
MRTYYNLKSTIRYALAILVVSHLSLLTVSAQSEGGLLLGAEADKKINKQLSISLEAELRTRNNFKTMDRWAVGLGMQYKLTNWLKADAGYKLLNTNFREDIDLKNSGAYNHWRPSYWGVKHRFYASLAGSYKFSNNIKLELSTDGTNWIDCGTVTNLPLDNTFQYYALYGGVPARYIRMYFGGSNYYVYLDQLRVFAQ